MLSVIVDRRFSLTILHTAAHDAKKNRKYVAAVYSIVWTIGATCGVWGMANGV